MDAKELPFLNLLKPKVQYLVPRWQRRYRWGEMEIERLIRDLLAIADADNPARPHYGGTMITVKESSGPLQIHRVVDGQQRLTTVSLLLAAIADTLGADGPSGDLTSSGIRRGLLTNPKKPTDQRRHKLRLQDGDAEEYGRIIEGGFAGSEEGAVADAWRLVKKRVDADNVRSLINGLHRLRVITIGLDDRDDAQQIFESLNATGKPLTEGEKVKNWLLMGLSEDVQDQVHDEHWLAIERELDARHDPERIDVFLRDVMRWWTRKMVPVSQTYDEFRRWAIREGRDNRLRRPELAAELATLAALYGQIAGTGTTPPSGDVKRVLDHLRMMGIDVHRPFTLRLLWSTRQVGESGQSPAHLVLTLRSVGSWITRLWLAGHSFTGLGKAIVRLSGVPDPADLPDTSDFWKQRIAEVSDQRCSVPSDAEVTQGIRLESKYGGKGTKATRAVLCAIMDWEQKGEAPECEKLTVEHIMPQTLNEDWRRDLGERAEEIHRRHLHRLGNLTLCGGSWGSIASNHSFARKKELYYSKSAVLMTHRLDGLAEWNEDAILRRAAELAEHALKLWPWTGGS